jgi:hypothetical protein
MRTVDVRWRHVAGGLRAAAGLEAELEGRWAMAIEHARDRRLRRRFVAACAAAAGSAVGAAVVLAVMSQPAYAVIGTVLIAIVCSAPLLTGRLARRSSEAPEPTDDLPARPSGMLVRGALRVWPRLGKPVALDVVAPWWTQIAHVDGPRSNDGRPFQEHGDVGESIFVADLSRQLTDEHVAIRNLLVTRGLDADVVVVGPTGIWVFEVKHWSGTIECRNGRWWQTKRYYAPGGVLKVERKPFRWGPDEQWIKEREAIGETIRRRLPEACMFGSQIGGGIVFSHQGANWDDIVNTVRSGYGSPAFWTTTVASAPELAGLTQAMVLQILDALLEWHGRLGSEADGEPQSAIELAEGLFSQLMARARDYCGEEAS